MAVTHMPKQASTAVTLDDLRQDLGRADRSAVWDLGAFSGRLCELSGTEATAVLTFAVGLVGEAQRRGDPVAWLTRRESSFYPPDVAATGVDLGALAVIWVPSALDAARTADLLMRSGAFGLVIMDLGRDCDLPLAAQSRLTALAKRHDTALVCLTYKDRQQPSVGSLVSLRAEATRTGRDRQGFRCEAQVLKDKRLGPGWTQAALCHGPDGLD